MTLLLSHDFQRKTTIKTPRIMKNFTHFFRLIPPSMIASQWKQHLTLQEDAAPLELMAMDPVSFSQEDENDDAGVYYTQNFSAVVKNPAVKAYNRQRAVIEMALSDGIRRYIGTKDSPVLLVVTPNLDRYVVKCSHMTVDPMDL